MKPPQAKEEPAPAGGRAYRAIGAVVGVATVGVLPVFLVGALAVQLRDDLGLTESRLGASVTAFFAIAALTSPSLGRLAERLGPQRCMRAAGLGVAVCLLALGSVGSWVELALLLMAAGALNALAQPSSNAVLTEVVTARQRGLAFGIKQSSMPAATLLGGLAVPAVALTVGWRWAFIAGAAMALAATVLVPAGRSAASGEHRPVGPRRAAIRQLSMLGIGAGLGTAAATVLGAFITSSGVMTGLSPSAAGLVQAIGSAIGLTVRVAAGWLGGRHSTRSLHIVAGMLIGGAAGFALISLGTPLAFLSGVALAFGAGWAWTGLFNFAVVERYPGAAAAATGITQTGVYAGAALGPIAFGFTAQHASMAAAWVGAAAVAVVAAAMIAVAAATLGRTTPGPEAQAAIDH